MIDISTPSSIVLNRYFTLEIYSLIKEILSPEGVLCLSFPAGENYMGAESTFLGTSLLFTLNKAFSNIHLKPGGSSIFFAFKSKLIPAAGTDAMERRLSSIPGLPTLFPAKNINSLYEDDRIDFQMQAYENMQKQTNNKNIFLNTDHTPESYLYCLAYTIRKLGGIVIDASKFINLKNLFMPFMAIITILYPLICIARGYFNKNQQFQDFRLIRRNELLYIIFAVSCSSMGINILLLFAFQTLFGCIYLKYGLVTALFMLGTFTGGITVYKLISADNNRPCLSYMRNTCGIHILACFIIYLLAQCRSEPLYMLLFFLAGSMTGFYAPICMELLKSSAESSKSGIAAKFETADYIGGALGALLTAVALIPLAGWKNTFLLSGLIPFSVILMLPFVCSNEKEALRKNALGTLFTYLICFVIILSAFIYAVNNLNKANTRQEKGNKILLKKYSDNPALKCLEKNNDTKK